MTVSIMFSWLILGLVWSYVFNFHISPALGRGVPLEGKSPKELLLIFFSDALLFPIGIWIALDCFKKKQ